MTITATSIQKFGPIQAIEKPAESVIPLAYLSGPFLVKRGEAQLVWGQTFNQIMSSVVDLKFCQLPKR